MSEKKIAVVTGGARGIGKAIALELAKAGNLVVINYNGSEEKARETKAEIEAAGGQADILQCNVADFDACEAFFKAVAEKYGRVDILVNNAGISMRAMFKDLDLSVIKSLMDVNFWGTVYCTKYALPYLLKSHGSVVGVISIAGFKGLPARTGYSASKFAIYGFLDTLRVEHLHDNLHVMIFAPGFTASNIRNTALVADGSQQGKTPRDEGKMMTAETVAHKLFRGVKRRKRVVVLTPVGKATVFLNKICPSLLDYMEYNYMKREPDSPFK